MLLDSNECCKAHGGIGSHPATCGECPRTTADELRRLHALNAELVAALKEVIKCDEEYQNQTRSLDEERIDYDRVIRQCRSALAKQGATT